MTILDGAVVLFTLAILWSLYRAHKDRNGMRYFNLFDLLMENGRVSRIGCVFMTALIVSSWLIIDLQVHGKMTEGYFGLYIAAWITPVVAKLFSTPPSGTTSTTETKTSIKTVDP